MPWTSGSDPGIGRPDLDGVQRQEPDALPYADFNGSGTLLTRYVSGPGMVNGAVVDELLARTSSGGTYRVVLDRQAGFGAGLVARRDRCSIMLSMTASETS